jgi:hypothetical protein
MDSRNGTHDSMNLVTGTENVSLRESIRKNEGKVKVYEVALEMVRHTSPGRDVFPWEGQSTLCWPPCVPVSQVRNILVQLHQST